MSVKILSREYKNAFRTETVDWLLGNVGDWLKAKFLVEVGVDYLATSSEPITINTDEKTITLMNGKKWSDYGFDIGNTVTMQYIVTTQEGDDPPSSEPVSFEFDIVRMYNDTMVYDDASDLATLGLEQIPTDRGNLKVSNVKLYVDAEAEGLITKYNHTSNAQVQNNVLTSFIDGNVTEALFVGLNTLGPAVANMQAVPNQSGMSIENTTVRKVTAQSNNDAAIFDIVPQEIIMSFDATTYKRVAETFQLAKTQGSAPVYNNVAQIVIPVTSAGFGSYTNGSNTMMVLRNSDFSETRYLAIDLNFKIINNTNAGPQTPKLKLCLYRYSGGASYDFEEKTVLGEWDYTTAIRGNLLNYQNIITLNVDNDESYALGFESSTETTGTSLTTRTFKIQTISGTTQILKELTDTSYKRQYEVEFNFMLSSFFEDSDSIPNRVPPAIVFDSGSLTDNIELKFFPEWNNPNVFIKNEPGETERLGNTGWFNENYNGLANNFNIASVEYFDIGGLPVETLSYGNETKVRAKITGIPNLDPDTLFQYGFLWNPKDETQYKDKITPFHKNVKINSPLNNAFALGTNNAFTYPGFSEDGLTQMDVRNVSFTQNGNDVFFEAIFKPTSDFTTFFDARPDDRNYCIWISVADATLETNFSNRVSLIVDNRDMEYFIPISGQLPGVTNRFIEHPEAETVPGVPLYIGFLEDDILSRAYFPLNVGDRLSQVIMGFEVENVVTGQTFELDRFGAALSQYVTDINGVQQLNLQTERGFKFAQGFNKNWVRIMRNTTLDSPADVPNNVPARSGYQILFGAKIRWEYWIAKQLSSAAQSEFFNASEPLNGFNNNWLSYLRAGSHKVNYFILFDVVSGTTTTRYKNAFEISFDGYDENEHITTDHKYFNDATNVQLSAGTDAETGRPVGMLLTNEKTRIEITFTKDDGDFDLANLYAVTTLEIDNGPGVMQHRQLSSIAASEFDNPLIPISGQTKLQIVQTAPNVIVTKCLVDNTKLQAASRYKITGRIGCFANTGGNPIETQIYENKYINQYQ